MQIGHPLLEIFLFEHLRMVFTQVRFYFIFNNLSMYNNTVLNNEKPFDLLSYNDILFTF